jgi:hypothetical protein
MYSAHSDIGQVINLLSIMKVSSLLGAKRTKFKTALAMEATFYIPVGIRRLFSTAHFQ